MLFVVTRKLARTLLSIDPCRDNNRRTQEHEMRYFDEQDKIRAKTTMARVGSWLSSRPMESWGFFVAGFVIARIIF